MTVTLTIMTQSTLWCQTFSTVTSFCSF